MELMQLPREAYRGKTFEMKYSTSGYYDIAPEDGGFRVAYRKFDALKEMSFKDVFFGEWLENPAAFGAFENGKLIGFAEGALETWNNRYRISNICVFDETRRRNGLGSMLMQQMLNLARESGARMAVLETQTCNERAIAFYRRHGFEIIGFDLFAYTNDDPQRHEVRLEMALKL